jgi:hypothetical protein
MESEGSLLCPQETSFGPYSEPDETNSYSYALRNINFDIIFPPSLDLPNGLFPSGFPTKIF